MVRTKGCKPPEAQGKMGWWAGEARGGLTNVGAIPCRLVPFFFLVTMTNHANAIDEDMNGKHSEETRLDDSLIVRDVLGLILPFLNPTELLVAERVSMLWREVTLQTNCWLSLVGSLKVCIES